ncbi:MAG: acyltransferase [bacterium]|nr:acyltransferase [bacterium]
MPINVVDPVFQTALFASFFVSLIVLTARRDPQPHEMNHSHTNELKGIAILMVLFSHIGYFLFTDHQFLYPFSVAGGVGVNLFLFLSGFGLTISAIKSQLPILRFYLKRLRNIFVPMWLMLIPVLVLDAYLLNRVYDFKTVLRSFLGFFPVADLDTSINSPLWYFSLILFYYLIFPLVFWRNKVLLSAVAIWLLGFIMTKLNLPVSRDVLKLYQLHYLAFPLGMSLAYIFSKKPVLPAFLRTDFVRYVLIILLACVFGYTAIHSGIGGKITTEHLISLVTMSSALLIVLLMNFQSDVLIVLGKYSYEIYLIQWPLMYRYDIIYKHTPAYLGTLLYLAVFLVIGFILHRLAKPATS